MKQIFSIIAFLLVGYAAQAQVITLHGSHTTFDTLTDAGTTYLTTAAGALASSGLSGNYDIEFVVTNTSGTTAGTCILESSIDGTNYKPHFKVNGTNGVNCDSFSFSGATSHIYTVRSGSFKEYRARNGSVLDSLHNNYLVPTNAGRRLYFRLKLVGTGTQVSKVYGKMITQN